MWGLFREITRKWCGEFHGAVGCEVRQWLEIQIAAGAAAPVSSRWKMWRRCIALSREALHLYGPWSCINYSWDAESKMVCPACGGGAGFRVNEKAEQERTRWVSDRQLQSHWALPRDQPQITHYHTICQSNPELLVTHQRRMTRFLAAMSVSDMMLLLMTKKIRLLIGTLVWLDPCKK